MSEESSGEPVLAKAGISLSDVDDGTKLAYAALTRRSVETIRYGPLILGQKLASGYSHSVFKAGPASGAGYKEFQLFQADREFTILIHVNDDNSSNDGGSPI